MDYMEIGDTYLLSSAEFNQVSMDFSWRTQQRVYIKSIYYRSFRVYPCTQKRRK